MINDCLVVGYDGREGSRAAVDRALSQLPDNGRLVLVYACRPLHAPADPLARSDERRELGRALIDELLLDGNDALDERNVYAQISDHDPVSALCEAAREHRASGIVSAAAGHRGCVARSAP